MDLNMPSTPGPDAKNVERSLYRSHSSVERTIGLSAISGKRSNDIVRNVRQLDELIFAHFCIVDRIPYLPSGP
jgi:hypothetical protein